MFFISLLLSYCVCTCPLRIVLYCTVFIVAPLVRIKIHNKVRQAGRKQKSLRIEAATEDEEKEGVFMEQPMFSLASYHGERKLAWKRICNNICLRGCPSPTVR